jgi:hypothetical protein
MLVGRHVAQFGTGDLDECLLLANELRQANQQCPVANCLLSRNCRPDLEAIEEPKSSRYNLFLPLGGHFQKVFRTT